VNIQELLSRWSAQSPEQFAALASRHLPAWVSLTGVILIAYYLSRATWLLMPGDAEPAWVAPQFVPGGTTNTDTGSANSQYDSISAAHLFGLANKSSVEPAIPDETEDAPDTRLNLRLHATVATSDQKIAHAIIADESGKEKVYFVGSSVPGGAKLHRIQTDRVILNRGGVLEALRLPREFNGGSQNPQRRAAAARAAAPTSTVNQAAMAANVSSLAEIIRPQPFMPNGQLKGYRVFPGRNRQMFIQLGLRPGDLVTEINGVKLDNPAQGMEIMNSLAQASQIDVTVERNGRAESLNLDLGQITSNNPAGNSNSGGPDGQNSR
jgi:general secretion pathway protein C